VIKRFVWIFLAMLLFWVALGNFIFNQYRLRDTFNQTRERLISIVTNAALAIDYQELLEVPLQLTGDSSLAYREISEKLETIKQANPSLKYVYIMATTDQPGILQYVVDADPAPQIITSRSPSALPGDKYDARGLPEMLAAYSGPAADKKINSDAWGSFISAYAPIRDSDGRAVAILGVDIEVDWIYALQKNVQVSGLLALAGFLIFLTSLFGVFVFRSQGVA
jgi:hypothetical protein